MSNTETIIRANEAAMNSYGSALRENEKYINSIEGKVKQFREATERLWSNAISSQTLKDFVEFATAIVNVTDEFGLLNTAIMITVGSLLIFKKVTLVDLVMAVKTAIANLVVLNTTTTLTAGGLKTVATGINLTKTAANGLKAAMSTLLPLLVLTGVLYGIKKIREYNQWMREVEQSAKDLKTALAGFNAGQVGLDELKDIIDGIDLDKLNAEIEKLEIAIQYSGGEESPRLKELRAYKDAIEEAVDAEIEAAKNEYWAKYMEHNRKVTEEAKNEILRISEVVEEYYGMVKKGVKEQELLNTAIEEMSDAGHLSQDTYEGLMDISSEYIGLIGLEKEEIVALLNKKSLASKEAIRLAKAEATAVIGLAKVKLLAYESESSSMEAILKSEMMSSTTAEERAQVQEVIDYIANTDLGTARAELEQAEAAIASIDNAFAMLGNTITNTDDKVADSTNTTKDSAKATKETVKELEQFYDILKQISESKYQMNIADSEEEQATALQNHITLLKEYNRQINEEITALDSLIDVTDGISSTEVEHIQTRDVLIDTLRNNNLEVRNLTSAYDELLKKEKATVADLQSIVKDVESKLVEMIKKREEIIREAAKSSYEEDKASMEQSHKDKLEAYDEELDAFKDMIDSKKKALEDQFDEEDYQEELDKLRREERDIQSQINILKLRDDVEARAKTIELEKDLSDKKIEITDFQRDHERDSLLDNLDEQLSEQEDYYDDLESEEERLFEFRMDKRKKRYDDDVALLDDLYTKEKIYAEAKTMLLTGSIEDIKNAYIDFENRFGEGLSMLGSTVIEDFIARLKEAREAVATLESISTGKSSASNSSETSQNKGYSNVTETDIMTAGGIKTKGYIIGGKTYYDENGQHRVDTGTYVDTTAGTYVLKEDGTGEKISDEKTIGSYATGTTNVPEDGLAYIHEGEAVIPKDFNPFSNAKSSFASMIKNGLSSSFTKNNGSSEYDININVAGNLDKSAIPNLKSAIKTVIKETDEGKYRRNKKIGIYNN